jgi:hypothetical protein
MAFPFLAGTDRFRENIPYSTTSVSVLDPHVFGPSGSESESVTICTDPDPAFFINKQKNEEKS